MEVVTYMQIIKRDGRVKNFQLERIQTAIKKAYLEVYNNDLEKYKEDYIIIEPMILSDLENKNKEVFDIEEVQDSVIKALDKVNKTISKAYKEYRENRKKIRESNTEVYKRLKKILHCSDVLNSNANVDEHSFGGRKFESAGVVMKDYALNNLMKPEVAQAHIENRIYQHDLDSYAVGLHNCAFADTKTLINETGFITRNGDVRHANGLSTAFQQLAVVFQIQSQEQFGGVGSNHLDYDLENQVNISFRKHFSDALYYLEDIKKGWKDLDGCIHIENKDLLEETYPKLMKYTMRELEKEGKQSAQGLYHNLNTLESRPGSQVPFTSINFGRQTTVAGRLISKWLLLASIDGIGKYHKTSIFPISIFQHKKGVNDKKGTPNYDLKQLAIKSMSQRIYPNWVNCDWSGNVEDPNNPDTFMATINKPVA
jgi:anaerobic ribonucleoside-triphosphate reductase